jgi:hypothetical protein
VAGVCSPIPEPTARVAVDTSTRYQTLVGFGAAVAYVNDEIVQHPRKAALYESMFAGLGLDVLRLRNHYGYAGEENLANAGEVVNAAAQSLGHRPTILLTSWSPPAALKASGATVCSGNLDTCTLTKLPGGSFDYAGFAGHWRASLEAYQSAGVSPDYIGIQNHPNWVPGASDPMEGCKFLPAEGTEPALINGSTVEVAYPGFAEALAAVVGQLTGLASVPKIVAPEVKGVDVVAEYAPYLDFSRVDAVAHHMYDIDPTAVDSAVFTTLGALGQQYQRPLLQTEGQADGFGTAVLMHYVLAVEGASAYLQNDFVESAASLTANPMALISLSSDDFTLEPPYHAVRHYSLHTDPGWVRVAASADANNLLTSAWLSPEGNALTIVLVNAGLTELDARIDLGQYAPTISEVTRTVFDGVERSAALGALATEGVLRVPGHAMITVALGR